MAKIGITIKDVLQKAVSSEPKSVATLKVDFLEDGSWNIDFQGVERVSIRRVQETLPHIFRAHAQRLSDIRFEQIRKQNDGRILEKAED